MMTEGKKKSDFSISTDLARMTVQQIRFYVARKESLEQPLLSLLETDSRRGVRAVAEAWRRRCHKEAVEKQRLEKLLHFERRLWKKGINWVAGIDEAGRGPLAGPVVAAAVILPHQATLPGLDDSKKVNPAKRETLFELIHQIAIAVGVGVVHAEEIDRINILQATRKAMNQAIESLTPIPQHLLVDGGEIPNQNVPQTGIIAGDSLSASIAAASIVAKVTRDRMMKQYDLLFPVYGFASHKGYGTEEHLEAIRRHGPCLLHRRCFKGVESC